MTQALRSELPFAPKGTRRPEPVLAHARVLATSKTYGWDGLYAEVGENRGWHVENLTPVGHYIALSRREDDFSFQARIGDTWQEVVMPPGSLWIQPAGEPFSFRVEQLAQWCGVVIQPQRLKGVIGSDAAVEAVIGLRDEILGALMRALCAEVLRGGTSGRLFADAMVQAIGAQLLRLFGEANTAPRGGITGRQLRIVADYVDAHLQDDIPVGSLAAMVKLSEAHFARAFKQSTGLSPHQYVIARRLERGKRLLADTGESIAQIALQCGFADQAHFTRRFAQHFGVSPSGLRKSYG
jgi:AraC family transcriptional regulator